MNEDQSQDLYEVLEINPNASPETVERMFRFLAQRYHPDRKSTGDVERFRRVVKAYDTLKNPESRAAYDSLLKTNIDYQWSLVEEAGDVENFEKDNLIQERVLSVLYTRRKRDPREPGLGPIELERLTGCPYEALEFHLWYLRDKGWIMRMEDGSMAITGDGVDQSLQLHQQSGTQKLITENSL